MSVNVVVALVIVALFVFTCWLLWPDMEREFDADMRRRIAELESRSDSAARERDARRQMAWFR